MRQIVIELGEEKDLLAVIVDGKKIVDGETETASRVCITFHGCLKERGSDLEISRNYF